MGSSPIGIGAASDLGGGIGGALGSLAGYWMTQDDRDRMNHEFDQEEQAGLDPGYTYRGTAQGRYGDTHMRPEDLQVGDIQRAQTGGTESAFNLGPSGMNNINVDPSTRLAQANMLGALQGEAGHQGLGIEDRVAQAQANAQIQRQAAGARGAILSNANQAGGLQGGQTLVAQLNNQQGATQQAADAGQNAAVAARQRALQAMMSAGNLGGQMHQQDYGEAAARAQAQDRINQFNVMNRQNVAGQNIDRQQQVNMANAQAENQRRFYNAGQPLNSAQYNQSEANRRAGAYGRRGDRRQGQIDRTTGMYSGVGEGVGSAAGGAAAVGAMM